MIQQLLFKQLLFPRKIDLQSGKEPLEPDRHSSRSLFVVNWLVGWFVESVIYVHSLLTLLLAEIIEQATRSFPSGIALSSEKKTRVRAKVAYRARGKHLSTFARALTYLSGKRDWSYPVLS